MKFNANFKSKVVSISLLCGFFGFNANNAFAGYVDSVEQSSDVSVELPQSVEISPSSIMASGTTTTPTFTGILVNSNTDQSSVNSVQNVISSIAQSADGSFVKGDGIKQVQNALIAFASIKNKNGVVAGDKVTM